MQPGCALGGLAGVLALRDFLQPSIHRFPGSMASRVQYLAATVQRDWNGDATAIWTQDDPDGQEVLRRLKGLPGFGE